MPARDIIVVGASAGGVEALGRLVRGLPADLPASVFIVLHMGRDAPSVLPEILGRCGALPVQVAVDGAPIQRGRVYVAVPDHHLLLRRDHMLLLRGPAENRARPAIDPLFRSAARAYGPRVAGVILTGGLNDGTAGILAVKRQGGVAIVQDPREAFMPSMPESAIAAAEVDWVLPLARIPETLARLAAGEIDSPDGGDGPANGGEGAQQAEADVKEDLERRMKGEHPPGEEAPGEPSQFSCPDCGGVLYELREGQLFRYRCRVGHGLSPDALLVGQTEILENALWTALRAIEDRAGLVRRLHGAAATTEAAGALYARQLRDAEEQADVLRALLRQLETYVPSGDGGEPR